MIKRKILFDLCLNIHRNLKNNTVIQDLNFEKILALFQYLINMMNENYLNYNLRNLMFKRTLFI